MNPLAYVLLGFALIYILGGLCIIAALREVGKDIDEDRK